MTRFAIVRNADSAAQVAAYLPSNYSVYAEAILPAGWSPGDMGYLIHGKDDAGWTLDGYVIPRLASGLIYASEVDSDALPA